MGYKTKTNHKAVTVEFQKNSALENLEDAHMFQFFPSSVPETGFKNQHITKFSRTV